jgi:hypothetical protein
MVSSIDRMELDEWVVRLELPELVPMTSIVTLPVELASSLPNNTMRAAPKGSARIRVVDSIRAERYSRHARIQTIRAFRPSKAPKE